MKIKTKHSYEHASFIWVLKFIPLGGLVYKCKGDIKVDCESTKS